MRKTLFVINLLMLAAILSILALMAYGKKNLAKDSTVQAATVAGKSVPQPSIANTGQMIKPKPKKSSTLLSAPLIKQLPELRNGCEITALTMLLQYDGLNIDKMKLATKLIRDSTPIQYGQHRKILAWGDPDKGFVGDITGKTIGYGVYHKPLYQLLKTYIETAIDLSGSSLNELEQQLSDGFPVVVWTTVSYTAPADKDWVTWKSPTGTVKATFKEHSVLLVGYDKDHVYLNDPLSGKKQVKVEKSTFLSGWTALGKQAISYE
ncbi:C39 family peptidase [Cohnella massiliensis]|uniref:C39 family peptidase n=1 Tax=Cohnella massiliensis TaxID=1816691 RepID=UPI0009BB187C|nr:C39 family peptidase [Cohnella massiliensis]